MIAWLKQVRPGEREPFINDGRIGAFNGKCS